jgi:DNA-binding winged helix-turn-helix (wHTH) protein
MRFERFDLDEENARLLCDGKPVDLPPKPFEVLCALARRPGSLLTKNALLDEVWGHRFVSESVLKTVIGKLRIALRDDAREPRFIETVPRRGYRFIAAESVAVGDPAAGPHVEHRPPHVSPARLDAGIAAERALREIREMLLLLVERPHEAHGAAARIADYIATWNPKTANEAR